MSDRGYYFAEQGEQRGPFTLAELATRSLTPATLVWREGLVEWQRADALPELAAMFAPPPSPMNPAPSPMQADHPQLIGYVTASPLAPASGMAIASLVLGILAILTCCAGLGGGIVGLPCSILAVVFGFIALKQSRAGTAGGRSMARAGVIIGFIYFGLAILVIFAFFAFAAIFMFK